MVFLRPWRPYRAGGVGAKPGPCILYARSYGGSQTVWLSFIKFDSRLAQLSNVVFDEESDFQMNNKEI